MSTINNQPIANSITDNTADDIVITREANCQCDCNSETNGPTPAPANTKQGSCCSSAEAAKPTTPCSADNLISISDFGRVELRVGQILEAESIPKSEKLLKLKVTLGESKGPRQILAGIAKHYQPESLILRKVVVVANLAPAKLMGNMSEGMLLCASSSDDGYLELLAPSDLAPIGSIVR